MKKRFHLTFSVVTLCASALSGEALASDLLSQQAQFSNGERIGQASVPGFAEPLVAAADKGDLAMVRSLLVQGENPDVRDRFEVTPLMRASQHGYISVVQALIEAKADVNAADVAGVRPLHAAARGGYTKVVAKLLASGAEVNARDGEGWTALMRSASRKDKDITKLLLENKSSVNLANYRGETALIKAVEHGADNLVEILLLAGADVGREANTGKTALNLAHDLGNKKIAALLASYAGRTLPDPVVPEVEHPVNTDNLEQEQRKLLALRQELELLEEARRLAGEEAADLKEVRRLAMEEVARAEEVRSKSVVSNEKLEADLAAQEAQEALLEAERVRISQQDSLMAAQRAQEEIRRLEAEQDALAQQEEVYNNNQFESLTPTLGEPVALEEIDLPHPDELTNLDNVNEADVVEESSVVNAEDFELMEDDGPVAVIGELQAVPIIADEVLDTDILNVTPEVEEVGDIEDQYQVDEELIDAANAIELMNDAEEGDSISAAEAAAAASAAAEAAAAEAAAAEAAAAEAAAAEAAAAEAAAAEAAAAEAAAAEAAAAEAAAAEAAAAEAAAAEAERANFVENVRLEAEIALREVEELRAEKRKIEEEIRQEKEKSQQRRPVQRRAPLENMRHFNYDTGVDTSGKVPGRSWWKDRQDSKKNNPLIQIEKNLLEAEEKAEERLKELRELLEVPEASLQNKEVKQDKEAALRRLGALASAKEQLRLSALNPAAGVSVSVGGELSDVGGITKDKELQIVQKQNGQLERAQRKKDVSSALDKGEEGKLNRSTEISEDNNLSDLNKKRERYTRDLMSASEALRVAEDITEREQKRLTYLNRQMKGLDKATRKAEQELRLRKRYQAKADDKYAEDLSDKSVDAHTISRSKVASKVARAEAEAARMTLNRISQARRLMVDQMVKTAKRTSSIQEKRNTILAEVQMLQQKQKWADQQLIFANDKKNQIEAQELSNIQPAAGMVAPTKINGGSEYKTQQMAISSKNKRDKLQALDKKIKASKESMAKLQGRIEKLHKKEQHLIQTKQNASSNAEEMIARAQAAKNYINKAKAEYSKLYNLVEQANKQTRVAQNRYNLAQKRLADIEKEIVSKRSKAEKLLTVAYGRAGQITKEAEERGRKEVALLRKLALKEAVAAKELKRTMLAEAKAFDARRQAEEQNSRRIIAARVQAAEMEAAEQARLVKQKASLEARQQLALAKAKLSAAKEEANRLHEMSEKREKEASRVAMAMIDLARKEASLASASASVSGLKDSASASSMPQGISRKEKMAYMEHRLEQARKRAAQASYQAKEMSQVLAKAEKKARASTEKYERKLAKINDNTAVIKSVNYAQGPASVTLKSDEMSVLDAIDAASTRAQMKNMAMKTNSGHKKGNTNMRQGRVQVAEAIRVPVTAKRTPIADIAPAAGNLNSGNAMHGHYWLKLGDFSNKNAAFAHFHRVTVGKGLTNLKFKTLAGAGLDNQGVALQIGPLTSADKVSELCLSFKAAHLGCSAIRE